MSPVPRPIVVSGPSGVGKGTVVAKVLQDAPNVVRSVSCTTRSPRPAEVDGIDYHFVDDATFDREVRIDAAALRSRSKNTPFDGWEFRGGVAATIVGGRIVYRAS